MSAYHPHLAKRSYLRRLSLAGAGLLTLAACTTATPYQPVESSRTANGGYAEQRIEANRFRVTFAGNSMTARDTVERYLLYRAAELTQQQGYDWFVMAGRDTEKRSTTYVDRPFGVGAYGYWGPAWRYYGRGFGWRSWDPYWGDPFWDRGVDIRSVDRYEAMAEIVMGRGPKPMDNVRAFSAADVIANLGPNIVRPN